MIEVPVTVVGQGKDRHYVWDCPHCQKRSRTGRMGIDRGCDHPMTLQPKKFDTVIAVFEKLSKSGQ